MKHSHSSFNRLAHAMRSSAAHRLIRAITFCLLIAASASYLFWSASVSAVTRTWDGGGANNNWNTAGNWSGDIVPGSGDVAVFDATSSKNASINVAISVAGIQIASGYGGTISQGPIIPVTLGSSGFSQSGGAYTSGISGMTVNGPFTLSAGSFTPASTGLSVAGDFTVSGGDFSAAASSVTFTGGNATIDVAVTETTNQIQINSTGTKTIASGDTLIAGGTVFLTSGSFNSGTIEAQAGVNLNANFAGGTSTLNITGGTSTLNGGGHLPNVILTNGIINTAGSNAVTWGGLFTMNSGTVNQGSVDFVGTPDYQQTGGTYNGGAGSISISDFTLTNGQFNSSQDVLSVKEDFTHSGGTFNPNSGKVLFDGSAATIDVIGATAFAAVEFDLPDGAAMTIANGDVMVVNGLLTHENGAVNGGELRATGGVELRENSDGGSTTLRITGGDATFRDDAHVPNLIFNSPGHTLNLEGFFDPILCQGNFTLEGGTVSPGGGSQLLILGSYTQTGGAFASVSFSEFLTVFGSFTLQGGTFNLNKLFKVAGNFIQTGGTLTIGHLELFGGNAMIDVLASPTLTFMVFNANNGAVKTFANNDHWMVATSLILTDGKFNGGTIEIFTSDGEINHSATFDGGTGTIRFDDGSIDLAAGGRMPNLTLVDGTVTTSGTGTIDFDGNLTIQGGTFNQGGVALNFISPFAYNQSGGTFNGGNASMIVNNFTLSGGIFNGPEPLNVVNNYTHTSGTFNHNNRTVLLTGNANTTIDVPAGETFNHLIVNTIEGTTRTIAIGDKLTVLGDLTLTNGSINGGEIIAKAGVFPSSNFDGGTTLLTIDGSATRTITLNAGGQLPAVTINAPNATVNTIGGGTITWDGPFTLQGGTVNQGIVNFIWSSSYSQPSGTVTGTFNGGSGTITTNSSFTHTGGTFTSTSSDLTVAGDFQATSGVFSADFNHNSGQVIFTGGNTAINVGGNEITLNRAKFNATDGTVKTIGGLGGALEIVGMLTLTNGNINGDSIAPTGGLVLESGFDGGLGSIFLNGGTAMLNAGGRLPSIHFTNVIVNTAGNGGVTFSGEFDVLGTTVINQAGVLFTVFGPYQQIGGTYNGGAADLTMNNSFDLSGGTFNRPQSTSRFSRDFTHSGGTFNPAGGPVIFDGGIGGIDVLSTTQFQQVEFDAFDGAVKTIAAADTIKAAGLLKLTNGKINGGKAQALAGLIHAAGFDGGNGIIEVIGGSATLAAGGKLPEFVFKSPGTLNTTGLGFLTVEGGLTVEAGTINQGTANFSMDGAYSQSGGTFNGAANSFEALSFTLTGGTFTAPTQTTSIRGSFTHTAGTFNHNGGTVLFGDLSGAIDVIISETFHHAIFGIQGQGDVKTIAAGDTLIITGLLNLTDGQVNTGVLEAQGNVLISDSFAGGTAALIFSGSTNQSLTNEGGVNPSGIWTIGKGAGAVTLASNLALGVGALDILSGTLNQGASFNLAAGTITIGAGGILNNLGTGDLTLFGNLTNSGQVQINGSGVPCGESDAILIRSSSAGTQRAWSGSGSFILIDADVRDQAGTAPLIAYSSTNSGNNGANWDIRSNCTGAPTDADLELFEATGVDGQVLIHWRTGFEVDNLGFSLYRDDNGSKTRLNPAIIAGSALVAGAGTQLTAGRAYYWKDDGKHTASTAQYWLEALDLNGQSAWHGPIHAMPPANAKGPAVHQQAALLDQLNTGEAQQNSTTLVEPKAVALQPTQMLAALQTDLAGHPAIKLSITHEGWYTVSQSDLLAAGLAPRTDPRFLQLFVDGQELPIRVTGTTDGSFDPADAVEFYGIGIESPYTNRHTYWLTAGQEPGKRIALADTGKGDSSPSNFLCTVERRDRVIYFSGLLNGDKENFFGPVISATAVDQSLDLRHVDTAADGRGELEVALQGVTAVSHRVKVTLNGNDMGALDFYGQAPVKMSFPISQRDLREGNNELTLVSQNGASDISLVDNIRLAYWHANAADNDSLRLTATGNQQIRLDGFTNPDIRVLDVTDQSDVQEVTVSVEAQSKSNYTATFSAPGNGRRTLLALTARQMRQPAAITANQPSSWRQTGRGADLLIITPRSFFGALESLQAQRQAQGLSVALIDIEDVYDEFSNGQKTPQAVKDFLAFAKVNWKKAPRYVLLAGDASYDTKNYLGHGDGDLVPTRLIDTIYMEAASDDWLADFNNDGLTEMAIGRLPAGTADEAAQMVKKLTAYAQAEPAEELLLVADENDGYSFESDIAELQLLAPGSLRVNVIQRGSMDIATARQQLQEGINRGQMIVNYAGHGSLDLWRGHLLMNADAHGMTNGNQLSLFVMMTCLNGYYIDPVSDSLAEALLKAEQGGAVAVWASSGMTLPIDQAALNQQFYRLLFSQPKTKGSKPLTMGEAAMQAKAAIRDIDVRTTWIFFGDPTMRLK